LACGARVRAEIGGFGANSDGHDLVMPEPTGKHAAECMRSAIQDAGLRPDDINAVNTHGTSTSIGDLAEVLAMKEIFNGRPPPFSSTKSMTGHPLGAAGALEAIFCVAMLEHGFIAPSINIEMLDPEFAGLPIVTTLNSIKTETVLSNSFGFGGTNASLLLRAFRQ